MATTHTHRDRTATIAAIGNCGHGACEFQVCVTVRFDDRPGLTENFEAATFLRGAVAQLVDSDTGPMRSSGALTLSDADDLIARDEPVLALGHLLAAVEYAGGVFHPLARELASILASSTHPLAASFARKYGL